MEFEIIISYKVESTNIKEAIDYAVKHNLGTPPSKYKVKCGNQIVEWEED